MKIVVPTGVYAPEIGGPATYTALLEEQLPQHGYEVVAVPFRLSRHLPKGIRHLHYTYLVWRAARGAGVVFAQDVVSVGLPARIATWLRGVPFWVRVPGDYAWEQSVQRYGVTDDIDTFQTKRQPWRVRLLQLVQRLVTRTAALVITPSDYFNQLVVGWGVTSDTVVTIYNGVDFRVTPAQVERPAGLVAVSAGRLVPWKGFATVIDALVALPDWSLVILGDGPDRTALEAQAQACGVADRVYFQGRVPREEVFGWCTAADVFVLNTAFESFSYQVVEAMAVGTPLIVTAVGSLPELMADADVGVTIPVNDQTAVQNALQDVIDHPDVWQARGVTAAKRAQAFTIDATVAALLKHLPQASNT